MNAWHILQPDPKSSMPRVLTLLLPPGAGGDPQMLRAAMLRNPDVNVIDPKDRTPLMMAAISETVPPDVVQEFITRGANVHAVSLDGLNALDYAQTLGRASTIEVLTRAGAKPHAPKTRRRSNTCVETTRARRSRAACRCSSAAP